MTCKINLCSQQRSNAMWLDSFVSQTLSNVFSEMQPHTQLFKIGEPGAACVARWQPPLNCPFCSKIRLKACGVRSTQVKAKHPEHISNKRLHKRIRRALSHHHFPLSAITGVSDKLLSLWQTLLQIVGGNLLSFQTLRFLQKREVTASQLLSLYRLAKNLEEPFQSRVRSSIASVMSKRNMVTPPANLTFRIPFLNDTDFRSHVRRFLTDILRANKDCIPLFHVPARAVMFQSHVCCCILSGPGKDRLRADATPCRCPEMRKAHPQADTPLCNLSLPRPLKQIVVYSAATQIYPSKRKFTDRVVVQVQKWCKHHHFSLPLRQCDSLWIKNGFCISSPCRKMRYPGPGRFAAQAVGEVCARTINPIACWYFVQSCTTRL